MTMYRSALLRQPVKESKPAKGPRTKKCKAKDCLHRFVPDAAQPLVVWCSVECGAVVAMAKFALQKLKSTRADRAAKKRELTQVKKLKGNV